MGMTNNQLQLIRAIAQNDYRAARDFAVACCSEDDTKKNAAYVKRYKEMLLGAPTLFQLPLNLTGLLTVEDVSHTFYPERYFVSDRERDVIDTVVKMHDASLRLMEMHIPYVNATLLYGEPGTGKTMFGRYMAYKLGLPFAYVNFSNLIDSYMGNTAKNLTRIFEYLRTQTCLIMLDEIDCIGLKRGNGSGPDGELGRTTISLMQLLDQHMSNEHILIAATNRYDRLDPALSRRFTVHHEVVRFSEEELRQMVCQYLEAVKIEYDPENIRVYTKAACAERFSQAKVMTDVVQAIANSVVEGSKLKLRFSAGLKTQ